MSLLHLPVVIPPAEVSNVSGCSCGGLDWHLRGCTIFNDPEAGMRAVAEAHQRLQDHAVALTRQLRAELAALNPGA